MSTDNNEAHFALSPQWRRITREWLEERTPREVRLLPDTLAALLDAIEAADAALDRVRALAAPGRMPDGEPLPEWVHVDDLRTALGGGED